jgi:hypothetical protein
MADFGGGVGVRGKRSRDHDDDDMMNDSDDEGLSLEAVVCVCMFEHATHWCCGRVDVVFAEVLWLVIVCTFFS